MHTRIVVVVVALLVAACGGGADTAPAPPPPDPAAAWEGTYAGSYVLTSPRLATVTKVGALSLSNPGAGVVRISLTGICAAIPAASAFIYVPAASPYRASGDGKTSCLIDLPCGTGNTLEIGTISAALDAATRTVEITIGVMVRGCSDLGENEWYWGTGYFSGTR